MISGYVNGEVEVRIHLPIIRYVLREMSFYLSNGYTLNYTIDTANVGQEELRFSKEVVELIILQVSIVLL
mgnify:CR=1 FL=1